MRFFTCNFDPNNKACNLLKDLESLEFCHNSVVIVITLIKYKLIAFYDYGKQQG